MKQNSESERRSPSSEDDRDERESRAEIQNAEEYNEIFQPKNSISEARPLPSPGSPPVRRGRCSFMGDGVDVTLLLWLDSQLIPGPQALLPGHRDPSRGPMVTHCPSPSRAREGTPGADRWEGAGLGVPGMGNRVIGLQLCVQLGTTFRPGPARL